VGGGEFDRLDSEFLWQGELRGLYQAGSSDLHRGVFPELGPTAYHLLLFLHQSLHWLPLHMEQRLGPPQSPSAGVRGAFPPMAL
jgi:hypothetical protein